MAIIRHEHQGHGDHGHDHEGAVGPHTHLTSVGIDIGSSTSHLMFSRLLIGYPSVLQRKPIVLERNVIARSPILLTPFSGNWNIEAANRSGNLSTPHSEKLDRRAQTSIPAR